MAKRTPVVNVTVTVAPGHHSKIKTVSSHLQKAGLKVDEAMGDVGIITGSVSEDKLADLNKIAGVRAVERQNTYQLPPPGSPVE